MSFLAVVLVRNTENILKDIIGFVFLNYLK